MLLVDLGNSRIKWACWRSGRLCARAAATHERFADEAFARATLRGLAPVARVVVASVAAAAINRRFARLARAQLGCVPEFVATAARAAGVINAYREPWRLGVDRWSVIVGAHHLFRPPRPVCVVQVGTAITIDLVDAHGRHRGGALVPGLELMRAALLHGTSGIRRRAAGTLAARRPRAFARNTRDALESGLRRAAAATVDRFAADAGERLGRRVNLLLTGGGVPTVAPLLRRQHRRVPDLLLRGLAVLALGTRGTRRIA